MWPHQIIIVWCLFAVAAIVSNTVWFQLIQQVNGLELLPYRNPLMQRMPRGQKRQILAAHEKHYPSSKLRLMVRISDIAALTFLLLFGATGLKEVLSH